MKWECDDTVLERCVVFFKVNDEWGGFSNMSNEFPLEVGGLRIGSSEALYQAMRFPHRPDWQKEILEAPHAMQAKMKSKKEGRRKTGSRPDWDQIQEDVMRWVLRVKLAHHPKVFGRLLRATEGRPIVERSSKDRYWGAALDIDGVLYGANRLGWLLADLRDKLIAAADSAVFRRVEQPAIADFQLVGDQVGEVKGRDV